MLLSTSMRILFLAPQPFFQDRGTPIAVRLAVRVIAGRKNTEVDLLTYHEGKTVELPNVNLHRIPAIPGVRDVGPGISIKKLICDLVYVFCTIRMVFKKRGDDQYQLVHAVEESVFIAWLIKAIWKIPYVYDMDSSLAMQVTEKWWLTKPLAPFLSAMEKLAVRGSLAVVPVCDALAVIADKHGSRDTQILRDISLLGLEDEVVQASDLRAEAGIPNESRILLYIGNLESYQGIDLLVDGFAGAAPDHLDTHLVIIGGSAEHIKKYTDRAASLGVAEQVHLIGQRPVATLSNYLAQADILASPRTKGNNTPMKIYSYLHSGKPIIATNLSTHTQVMDGSVAMLVEPDTANFKDGLKQILENDMLSKQLGRAARELAEERYTFDVFTRDLNSLYDRLAADGITTTPATGLTGLAKR